MKGFYHYNGAWYAADNPRDETDDEIMVGLYDETDGKGGEFGIRWRNLQGHSCPRLEMFSDAWELLESCSDFIDWLRRNHNRDVTPAEVVEALRGYGYADKTPRTRP